MIPYGTAAEAETALGRSMSWVEALWFRYSATMPDFYLTWHIALIYLVLYVVAPMPILLLEQFAPGVALRYKLQPWVLPPPPVASVLNYIKDSRRVTLAVIGPFSVIYFAAFKVFGMRMGLPLPSASEIVSQLVVYSLMEDYLSYWVHRLLHTEWGYKKIHAVHHEVTTPDGGFGATYAHGYELTIFIITTFVGPAIVPCHVTMHWLWFGIRVLEAIDVHSGYKFPFNPTKLIPFYGGAEFHDYHHYVGGKSQSNFGSAFTYCDYIYGTNKGYKYHKERLANVLINTKLSGENSADRNKQWFQVFSSGKQK